MSEPNKQQKTQDFRFSLTDDMTHRELYVLKFTRSSFIVKAISTVVVALGTIYFLFAFTPLRMTIPGYPDASSKKDAVRNAIRIDSLERLISRWEFYSGNLLSALESKTTLSVDSLMMQADAGNFEVKDPSFLGTRDSLLIDLVVSGQQFTLNESEERKLPIEGMHFFLPLKGVMLSQYDAALHPYVEITAQANAVVMSALDGTVIYDGWSDAESYTIVIQHENDLVTVYKHNQKLLKKSGDKVSAGTSIGLLDNSGEGNTSLHFEIWYHGTPVDPSKYINF